MELYRPYGPAPQPTVFRQLHVGDMIQIQILAGEEWRNLYGEYHRADLAISRLCHDLRSRGYRADDAVDDPKPISDTPWCGKPIIGPNTRMICSLLDGHPGECVAF